MIDTTVIQALLAPLEAASPLRSSRTDPNLYVARFDAFTLRVVGRSGPIPAKGYLLKPDGSQTVQLPDLTSDGAIWALGVICPTPRKTKGRSAGATSPAAAAAAAGSRRG